MTPGARVAAAIEVLDSIAAGTPAEQALSRWARRSRFAGSKDRAAIRDHVFDVLRCRRSAAHAGGGEDGRALMLGLLRLQGQDPTPLFDGAGHAPAPLTPTEGVDPGPVPEGAEWDLPDWLIPRFHESLGTEALPTARALRQRAPVTLRVNAGRLTRAEAAQRLAEAGVLTRENPLCDTALTVEEGARKLRNAPPYLNGDVELQDASSQAATAGLPPAGRILDYCAGGGGKALAMAARRETQVFAHDIDPARMRDLPERAARAGVAIPVLKTPDLLREAPFDIVFCDAPCSGSGAWRRAPEGKWLLTPDRLTELTAIQDGILDAAAPLVAPGGMLVYATCSVLGEENGERIAAFTARSGWKCDFERSFTVSDEGDGFFVAHLTRADI